MGDHRLAEDRLQAVEILDVGVRLGDQHVLEVLGLGQEHDPLVGEIDGDNRTIALGHLHDDVQRIIEAAFQQGRQLEPNARFLAEALRMRRRGDLRCGLLCRRGHDVSPGENAVQTHFYA